MPPVRALDPAPPLRTDHARGRRRRHLLRREMSLKHKRPPEPLRLGLVTGRVHEVVEPLVRHRGHVDPERRQLHFMHRPFAVGGKPVAALVAHQKPPARQQHHPVGRSRAHARKSRPRAVRFPAFAPGCATTAVRLFHPLFTRVSSSLSTRCRSMSATSKRQPSHSVHSLAAGICPRRSTTKPPMV